MLLQAMPACLCAAEPLLDTPSSLPAVQLQLRMVESTIANAEHDLEASVRAGSRHICSLGSPGLRFQYWSLTVSLLLQASWLNTCFPQPAPGFYVDEVSVSR